METKGKQEKISIIIPIYNTAPFLEECLKSIIYQTYLTLEIILINDGSTDESGKICEKYANIDKRIKYFNRTKNGVSAARNFGLEQATGEFIGFVDSDDIVLPNMFELLYNEIINNNCHIAICDYFTKKDEFENEQKKSYERIILNSKTAIKETLSEDKWKGFLWNKLFRKEIVKGIVFNTEINICEDLLFVCQVLKNDLKVVYINKKLYYYRENPNSITNKNNINKFWWLLNSNNEIENVVRKYHPHCKNIIKKRKLSLFIFWAKNLAIINQYNKKIIKRIKIELIKLFPWFLTANIRHLISVILILFNYNSFYRLYQKYYLKKLKKDGEEEVRI